MIKIYKKRMEEKYKLYGLEFKNDKFDKLPQNKCFEVVYSTGRALKKKKFKVVVSFARVGKLYFDRVDHNPLSYSDVKSLIVSAISSRFSFILIDASLRNLKLKLKRQFDTSLEITKSFHASSKIVKIKINRIHNSEN